MASIRYEAPTLEGLLALLDNCVPAFKEPDFPAERFGKKVVVVDSLDLVAGTPLGDDLGAGPAPKEKLAMVVTVRTCKICARVLNEGEHCVHGD